MLISFSFTGVPKNWLNRYANHFSLYQEKREWLEITVSFGIKHREKAGVPVAPKGHPIRRVEIIEYRKRMLDRDGLYASAKPIIDGCKSVLRRKVTVDGKGKFVEYSGAGLFYSDDDKHIDLKVSQEKTPKSYEWTEVRVEIDE